MSITKSTTVHFNNVTLAAGTPQSSTGQDLTAIDKPVVYLKITNGATGPTIAAQFQIEVSDDNSNWYNYGGPLQAGVANSGIYSWGGIPITEPVMYVRVAASGNTTQSVTIRVYVSGYLKT